MQPDFSVEEILSALKFNEKNLIPAIVQDHLDKQVLMMAWMNPEAVRVTLTEKRGVYYSRSRRELWRKGETSGHVQKLVEFSYDCDADTILLTVEQTGPACHTGTKSCFFKRVI